MALEVSKTHQVRVNITKAEVGDILVVKFKSSHVHLMLVRTWNGLYWRYTNASWLPEDRQTMQRQLRSVTHDREVQNLDLPDDRLVALVGLGDLVLDQPLRVMVFSGTGDGQDSKKLPRVSVGHFSSAGGNILDVVADRLPH